MELKYTWVLIIGIIATAIVIFLSFFYKVKISKAEGIKLANTDLTFDDKFYKKEMIKYYVMRVMLILSCAAMIILSAVLLARPYYIRKIKEQKYNRDIILCMDISSSVNDLNEKLVKDLQDTVRGLSGERIGIVIFNTSPVILSPLTDDYEYTINQLENIREAIRRTSSPMSIKGDDWMYWHEYLYGGTLVGNEIRGSSLIGDGLLGGLFAFPEDSKDRTKIIIFSTDNDPNGDGFVNLMEAAEYCKHENVTVYGIGTELMYTKDMEEMKAAVDSTGGKFFVEEKASEFHKIVEEIEDKSGDLTNGRTIVKLIESPQRFFRMLVASFVIFVILSLLLRRANVLWVISQVAMCLLLVGVYVFAVIPADQFSKGPDFELKRKSNLNVLFVIDDTISMLAEDMEGGKTRLDKVKEDCCNIVDELEGAQFSVISFNNDAMLLAPFSSSVDHVKNSINSLYPLESYYAKGTSFDKPKQLMLSLINSIKSDEKQKVAVFYISDGEITGEDASSCSYSEFNSLLDGGAVLGYGTEEGGKMRIKSRWDDSYEEIKDYSNYPSYEAISRINESNLNSIAEDMGISYVNMSFGENIDGEIRQLKNSIELTEEISVDENVENKEVYITPPKYYGFLFMIPFVLLVMLNAVYIIRIR